MKSVLGTSKAEVKVISAVEHMANKIFQLYSNFLLEEARQPWNKILAKEINSSLWKDLRGIVHNTPRIARLGTPLKSVSHYTCSQYSVTMPLKHKRITSVIA